ncbi:hypothetical protein U5922_017085 [Aquicoccus sp. G2-2]|uniref:hypothetical protein n=1 Tax=Aquicoccus sp. G2-2 TaxID=3092120 RepID=UPI002ADF261C|nr:hypothetical protein [Aquicoccus sp. G2-2]MEA1115099.1 hypothetical protein [Aquicoccus sp. G2-2]
MRHFMFCLVVLSLVAFAGPKPLHAQTDEGDRGYIQGLLEDALSAPGRTVRMEGFAGALSSRATIDKITVTDPEGVWLTASDLVLVWNRSALLRGEVDIDEITIGEIDLPRRPVPAETPLPAPEASGAFALPELPVSVNIAKMAITKAVLGKALFGEAAEVSFSGKAALASGAGSVTLAVKRLDRAGTFSLTGAFDNATRVLDFDLNLTEPEDGIAANLLNLPGKPPVVLSVQGKDPVSDFNATIRLATDGKERLSGKVELTTAQDGATRFSTELQGDVAPVVAPQFAAFLGDDVALVASGERAADGDLLLDKLHVKTAAMQIGGSAEIGADGWPRKLLLNAQITPPAGDSVILPLPGPQVSVREADFSAQFDAAAGDSWRIDGRADGVDVGTSRVKVATFAGEGKILRDAQSVTGGFSLTLTGWPRVIRRWRRPSANGCMARCALAGRRARRLGCGIWR